jgi:hypothetical protein
VLLQRILDDQFQHLRKRTEKADWAVTGGVAAAFAAAFVDRNDYSFLPGVREDAGCKRPVHEMSDGPAEDINPLLVDRDRDSVMSESLGGAEPPNGITENDITLIFSSIGRCYNRKTI